MKKRVLTGYRPTGKLHLGHLHGNLHTMLELQVEFECFFFIADWHALTTDYANTENLKSFTKDMVIDWLAVGLDPSKCVIYRQSDVPEIAELALYLSMLTPIAWLERNPTYKEQLVELKKKEIATHGFIGYPVLQAADILSVHADFVPVGEDQLPHLELSREIARRFNHIYGDYLKEPAARLSKAKRVPGIDGRKMSKSYNNAIYLDDDDVTIEKKVMKMITDEKKIRRDDPGRPEVCNVFEIHRIYSPDRIEEIEKTCRSGELGCVDDKRELAKRIIASLGPFREKKKELTSNPSLYENVLAEGAIKAHDVISDTLKTVRKMIKID